ncbi:stage II sporulation protein R [Shouchella clausii]|uniref:stage II sporulation protein R n=1 Tax=Shouchella clausii TaxID=79880 RepID=UPI003983BBF9
MKPRAIMYLLISLFVGLMSWEAQNAQAEGAYHGQVSADDAIRLRILANSDSIADQALKREIRDEVNAAIGEWIGEMATMEEAAAEIALRVPELEAIVAEQLAAKGVDQNYSVAFDKEVSFPTKLYGNMVYPAGLYHAVLITLGEGQGENWWCVLFPPLCFLDMDNGEATNTAAEGSNSDQDSGTEETAEVETSFFFVEWFESIWDRLFA